MSDDIQNIRQGFEINFSSILTSLILGAIIFSAAYLFNNKSEVAILSTQIATLQSTITELRNDVKTIQANSIRRDEFDDLKKRVQLLEHK
jgi:peptidoglycan hydrolase CwlO-like protein